MEKKKKNHFGAWSHRFARALAADLSMAMEKKTQLYLMYPPQVLECNRFLCGVETHEQLDRFMDIGYMNFQGYLFSRPLTSEQCTAFILKFKKNRSF